MLMFGDGVGSDSKARQVLVSAVHLSLNAD